MNNNSVNPHTKNIKNSSIRPNKPTLGTTNNSDNSLNLFQKNNKSYSFIKVDGQDQKIYFIPVKENIKKTRVRWAGNAWHGLSESEKQRELKIDPNRAILTGEVSNVFVLDLDAAKKENEPDGIAEFDKLLQQYNSGNPINTLTASTPRSGRHLYFKYDPDIKTTTGVNGLPIDIRNDSAYIMVWPSVVDGKQYIFTNKSDIIAVPQWLKEWILQKENKVIKKKDSKKEKGVQSEKPDVQNKPKRKKKDNPDDIKYKISDKRLSMYLDALDPKRASDYKTWIEIGMCCRNINKSFEVFDAWSRKNEKYEDWEACRKQYNYFKDDIEEKLEIGSLRYFIKQDNPQNENIISDIDYKFIGGYKPITSQYNNCMEHKSINMGKINEDIYKDFDLVILKSDTNTGKTTSTAMYCNEFRYMTNEPYGRVICIGSLISMIDQYKASFESEYIESYCGVDIIRLVKYDDDKLDILENNICITLNSLLMLQPLVEPKNEKYIANTIIYIDEINTVLTYLLNCDNLSNISFLVYKLLRTLLIRCKKIIMTDADVSDLVFAFLQPILKERKNTRAVYIDNTHKNYTNIPAFEVTEKTLIDKLREEIRNKRGFILCFDSRKKAEEIYQILSDKNDTNFIFISGKNGSRIDVSKWTDKHYIFFTPKIMTSLDYVPQNPINVYVYSTGKSISPLGVVQQLTRSRKISALYYHMTAIPKTLKFETLEDLIEYFENDNQSLHKTLDFHNISTNEVMKLYKNNQMDLLKDFEKLNYLSYYQKNIFDVDFKKHFEEILINKGFTLQNLERGVKESICIKKLIEQNKDNYIKLDDYQDYIENKTEDETIIKTMENIIKELKIEKIDLQKYKSIICNGNLKDHYNLCALIKKTEMLENNLENAVGQVFDSNIVKSRNMKAILLHDIEKLLGIQTLDIDSKKYTAKYNNPIEIPDNIYKLFIKLFRSSRKKPNIWQELYFMLIAGYKSLTGNLNVITSKSTCIKVQKKSKNTTYYNLNKDSLRLNLELLDIRSVSMFKYQENVYGLVGLPYLNINKEFLFDTLNYK